MNLQNEGIIYKIKEFTRKMKDLRNKKNILLFIYLFHSNTNKKKNEDSSK